MKNELELKLKELQLEKQALEMKQGLPHLHLFKHYRWSRKFFESTNKECFLNAANQIGKSSIQIRRVIHWATEQSLWPKLWPHLAPNMFWYFYPNKDLATQEYYSKWLQFLPAGKYKDDPKYGWEVDIVRSQVHSIRFNSGVTVYFKTYSQKAEDLQAGSVFYVALDEECPLSLLPELQNRLNATDGYMSMAFTATLGQDYWRRTMEALPGEVENHPTALKQQVSLYDCQKYEDGSPTHWTLERIKRVESRQPTNMDVLIRVHGKFASAGGRKYEAYDPSVNRGEAHPYPKDWLIFSGVDIGSGGENGHPASICFVAVDPLYRKGRVFKAWRGDGISTTSGDVYVKYVELRGTMKVTQQFYDWSSAEFRQVAESNSDSFEQANKNHQLGENIINTLFKHKMLSINYGDFELDKLSTELTSLMVGSRKRDGGDDLVDSMRYACTRIPWDFSFLEGLSQPLIEAKRIETEQEQRRGNVDQDATDRMLVDMELEEWNEHYGS